jgi:hypothetical protein
MSNKYMQYDNTHRLKSSRGLVTEDQKLIRDDTHENQKGKHQINDMDGLQRENEELNNVLFPIPQLVYTVILQENDRWRTSQRSDQIRTVGYTSAI